MAAFEQLLEDWDGEMAVIRRDRETGGWMFICVHSTVRGPAGGGTRMKVYPAPEEGLADALRLSGAMSRKLAVAGLDFGGGKAVLAVPGIPAGQARRALFERFGDLVASLGGTYRTSSDMNTGEADMDVIGERTPYVFGRSVAAGGAGDPARPTALGVLHGIRASLQARLGSPELSGRVVALQGAGSVGSALAEHLARAGASLLIADIDPGRAAALAGRTGATAIAAADLLNSEADVYAPCAVGGVLDAGSARRLRCAVVAGSANNQLADPDAAGILHERGILYAPDYVINAGGAIGLVGREQLGWDDGQLEAGLARIGHTLAEIYETSSQRDVTTAQAAEELARRRLTPLRERSARLAR